MNRAEIEKKIKQIVHELVNEKGYVCSVDVLMRLNYLTKTDYENWRFGRIEYLEKICQANLGKLSTINRFIRQIAAKTNLKPSWTGYNKYGKGAKTRLRFSKSGNENIEKLYATHYISEYVMQKLKQSKQNKAKLNQSTDQQPDSETSMYPILPIDFFFEEN